MLWYRKLPVNGKNNEKKICEIVVIFEKRHIFALISFVYMCVTGHAWAQNERMAA